jgi:putative membrane protein
MEHGFHHFHHMMRGPGFGFDGPGMIFGNLLWLVLLGVLAWTVISWLASKTDSSYDDHADFSQPLIMQPPALEILRQRYARGEIDADTFEQMRERIEASYRPPYR